MNQKERFFGEMGYAPSTIGAPAFIQTIDYDVFKQTPEQRGDAIAAKYAHKKLMVKNKIDPNKYLNIPSKRLESSVKMTF